MLHFCKELVILFVKYCSVIENRKRQRQNYASIKQLNIIKAIYKLLLLLSFLHFYFDIK